jgi:hypothetical protein
MRKIMSNVIRFDEIKNARSIVKNWTDEIFSNENPRLPFSFVYGGRRSEDFISSWKFSQKVKEPNGIMR